MESIQEVKEHCKFVAAGIVQAVIDGEDLGSKFEGSQQVIPNVYGCVCQGKLGRTY